MKWGRVEERVQQIRANLGKVREQIFASARKAGRDPGKVRIVVVTKGQPVEVVVDALEAGAEILGENYPEEAVEKIQALGGRFAVDWHMIGHLQSRKTNLVIRHFQMLESLDRLDLAVKLDRRLADSGMALPVLLEFNVANEANKSGWPAMNESDWPKWIPEVGQILALPNLRVMGLMAMPPLVDRPEDARPHFRHLASLQKYLVGQFPQANLKELSMGTSADYPIAVEEGATIVRIGTAILGERPLKRV